MSVAESSPLILIVDDDSSGGKTLQAILRRVGYRAEWVGLGKEAIRWLEQSGPQDRPQVALLDIRLPDLNGVQVLQALKKIDPEIGAIMMTGNADMDTAIRSLNEGAYAYMQKPYNVDELKSVVQKVVEKHRLVRENRDLMGRLQRWNEELEKTVQEKTAELKSKNLILLDVVERLKVLNEMKSRFVANASHELQTPMTSILGFSSMLIDYWNRIDKGQAMKFLAIIRDEAQRLTRIVRDLLDLSRIQDGRMHFEFKPVDLKEVAEKVRQGLKMVKESVRIEISFEKGAREVIADEDKIQQVLTNLGGNAVKFSPAQKTVRIIGREAGDAVTVSVADEGPGIPEDKREKIFEPFYRIHGDAGQKERGTGLGLPIAKAIIEALGGSLRVESEPGQGSTFTFELPKDTRKGREQLEKKTEETQLAGPDR